MENPNQQPSPGEENKSSRIKPLTREELDALNKLTRQNVDSTDEDHRAYMLEKIFTFSDIDKDHLRDLTSDQLDFIYDALNLGEQGKAIPGFNTRLENTNRLKEILLKFKTGEL